MKHTILHWLGLPAATGLLAAASLLAFALLPAIAQSQTEAAPPMGTIHGLVTSARSHALAVSGTVTLTNQSGNKKEYTFKISKTGTYGGEVPAGVYTVRVLMQDQSGFADYSRSTIEVKIAAGQDLQQDLDLGNLVAAAPAIPIKGPTGSIHGRVIGPDGLPTPAGTVSLNEEGSLTTKYAYPVNEDGNYSGVAAPGKYTLFYRAPNTPPDKVVDQINGIKIVAGQDLVQDDDMSRKEFIDKMSPEARKQLELIKQRNEVAMKDNEVIRHLNADIKETAQIFRDADGARAAAVQALGASASPADINAKEAELKAADYTKVETVMQKDTAAKPDASILWADLGQAEAGLKKYDQAEVDYKKALAIETAATKPIIDVEGLAYSGLGEVYARTGKVAEANANFDLAAKINPSRAGVYYKNEAVIFYQENNSAAQAAAADKAIEADPNSALAYYLKGNGLVANTTVDPKTHKLVPPPGCMEAYEKYLELAPNGPYVPEVKNIFESFGQKVKTSYTAGKK